MIQKVLADKIPQWQEDIKSNLKDKGDKIVGEVTVAQTYGGMRGIIGLTCETSSVSPDKGLMIRERPISEISHLLPEEVFYLLLTGEIPNSEELSSLQGELKNRRKVPSYVWNVIESLPEGSHPMTMLSVAVQSMRSESRFVDNYNLGMPKSDYWKYALEDGLKIIATLPEIAAGIYRLRIGSKNRIDYDTDLDWAGNFAHMLGIEGEDFKDLMRLFLNVHCDHGGGNVSAFSSLTVASALSSPFLALVAGYNGLAGPLHGLANQECLKFVLDIRNHFKKAPSDDELKKYCWDRLSQNRVIPGYGHAVLRCPDPRFVAFMEFGKKHIKNDETFEIVKSLFEIVPPVLEEHGKAKNPWPNVDAASGSLLYYYGLKEFNYYTVLFSLSRTLGIVSQIVLNRAVGIPLMRPKAVTSKWIKNSV